MPARILVTKVSTGLKVDHALVVKRESRNVPSQMRVHEVPGRTLRDHERQSRTWSRWGWRCGLHTHPLGHAFVERSQPTDSYALCPLGKERLPKGDNIEENATHKVLPLTITAKRPPPTHAKDDDSDSAASNATWPVCNRIRRRQPLIIVGVEARPARLDHVRRAAPDLADELGSQPPVTPLPSRAAPSPTYTCGESAKGSCGIGMRHAVAAPNHGLVSNALSPQLIGVGGVIISLAPHHRLEAVLASVTGVR